MVVYVTVDVVGAFGSANADATPETETSKQSEVVCEHFALADAECNFYHYIVEGNVARDSIKVLPEVREKYADTRYNHILVITKQFLCSGVHKYRVSVFLTLIPFSAWEGPHLVFGIQR